MAKHGLSRSAIACQLDTLIDFVASVNHDLCVLEVPTDPALLIDLGNIQGSLESLRNSV